MFFRNVLDYPTFLITRFFQDVHIRGIVYFHVHIVTAIVFEHHRDSAVIADRYGVFFSKHFDKLKRI